jgi:hyperosmotically inducible periplasmic protein
MRNLSLFHQSAVTVGVLLVFAVIQSPLAVATDVAGSPQAASASSSNESMSAETGDTWITTKVKSELASAKDVKSTDISVTTTEGVVALSGTVASSKQKSHVVHITKMVKGVKSVDASGLTVTAASSTSGG